LQRDGQAAVIGRCGFGGHPRDDFLLQHDVQVPYAIGELGNMKQHRRADVIGQIADDAQTFAELCEIEFKRIRLVQRQCGTRKIRSELGRKVAVDFHGRNTPGPFDQARGQRGQTGADLDDIVAGTGIDRFENSRDVARIDEKVLTETAPGNVAAPFDLAGGHYGRIITLDIGALSPTSRPGRVR